MTSRHPTSARHLLLALLAVVLSLPLTAQEVGVFPLNDSVFARMAGASYKEGCPVGRAELRYVRVMHVDAQGNEHLGELVCHHLIANDLLDIFTELYRQRYPIERMRLIDDYQGDDERSMQANNTSCFCYRPVAGSTRLSAHARGLAVDVNPLYNPCVKRRPDGTLHIQPQTGSKYADRTVTSAYKLVRNDLCYRLFIAHGFKWGGAWQSLKDYQHFESNYSVPSR